MLTELVINITISLSIGIHGVVHEGFAQNLCTITLFIQMSSVLYAHTGILFY